MTDADLEHMAIRDPLSPPSGPLRTQSAIGRNPSDRKHHPVAAHGVAFASLVLVRQERMEVLLGQKEVFDDFEFVKQVGDVACP